MFSQIALKRKRQRTCTRERRPEPDTLSSTGRTKHSNNGHHQRRRGEHRRRPCRDHQAAGSRAASAEGKERAGDKVQLLQGRQGGDPGRQRARRRRVPARGGGRGDRVRGAGFGARGRPDVHGGHRAEPRPEQQPAGVDPPGRLRPHLVPLHRLHLWPRRGRGVRRPLALSMASSFQCNNPRASMAMVGVM